jgi:sulfite reductase (NADPH) flavoprotein alpha-component
MRKRIYNWQGQRFGYIWLEGEPGQSLEKQSQGLFDRAGPELASLNKPGSQKDTWHIEFDLSQSGLDYAVGDNFGIMPRNDLGLVEAVIAALAPPVPI